MNKIYTTSEVANLLNVSDRTVRRYLNSYFTTNKGTFEISHKMVKLLENEHFGQAADSLRTQADSLSANFDHVEYFTEEEYREFHKRLSEYPVLKDYIQTVLNELEYHKKSAESHNRQMEIITRTLEQRNYIEAKEKRLETK